MTEGHRGEPPEAQGSAGSHNPGGSQDAGGSHLRPPKVAKTLIDGEVPESKSTGKVAKTLMDADIPATDRRQETAKSALETEIPPNQTPRELARTLLETDIPATTEPLNTASTQVESGVPGSIEPGGVAKTLLETNAPVTREPEKVSEKVLETSIPETKEPEKAQHLPVFYDIMSARAQVERKTAQRIRRLSREKKEKISKTLLEYEVEEAARLIDTPSVSSASGQASAKRKRSQQFVAKTMLDHNILLEAVSNMAARKAARAAELEKERQSKPATPFTPVEADKEAAKNCPWSWSETKGQARFRSCAKCQMCVYNLDGIDMPEAQALIYKRENRRKFTLYRRADGKFMTSDCPVALKHRRDMILISIGGMALLVAAIVITILGPHKPAVVEQETPPAVPSGPPRISTGKPGHTAPGSFHYENGKITEQPKPAATATTTTTSTTPDPDENGNFWQFSGDADAKRSN